MIQKGNLAKFEGKLISETREATPTKIGVHAQYINPYLHDFLSQFRLIKFFHYHGLIHVVHGPKGKFGQK